jgi:hypothetical protein
MIRETELNIFVPSPELLVLLASGERPLGVRAGPPRIRSLRETYFDTPDQALRRRGMTCKLRQEEGQDPDVVVTLGEGPDEEGITSRSRLTASAVGFGLFETLRGDSEPAILIQKIVDPGKLRPQIAIEIQRLGRAYRRGFFRKASLLLHFDRITVQGGGVSSVFHELRIRRRGEGGPTIQELALHLRDCHHLFPDGLSTLQRAYRILAMDGRAPELDLSPYALSLAWAAFKDGQIALKEKEFQLCIPTFRGSGEDAARALSTDILGTSDVELIRLGTTEPRAGRPVVELWAVPDAGAAEKEVSSGSQLVWFPWHELLEVVGREDLQDPVLVSALLLLTRRRFMGQLPWIPPFPCQTAPMEWKGEGRAQSLTSGLDPDHPSAAAVLEEIGRLLPILREVEDRSRPLQARLESASELSRGLSEFYQKEVTETKGRILSVDTDGREEPYVRLLDLVCIRARGMLDRLGCCMNEDLIPALEGARVHLRPWSELMHQERQHILKHFEARYLPAITVAPEWGPSFLPHMPPAGCAVGLMARSARDESTRFFHMVLAPDTPSFIPVPGTTTVLPLEEVVRGYLFHLRAELEKEETFLFRFTTGEATVKEPAPPPPTLEEESEVEGEEAQPEPEEPSPPNLEAAAGGEGTEAPGEPATGEGGDGAREEEPPPLELVEVQRSIVARILVQHTMSEGHQAQLLRGLERQVTNRDPLIGWSDLYVVHPPLDLTGLDELLRLDGE